MHLNPAFMDRFMLVRMDHPAAEAGRVMLRGIFPAIPAEIMEDMAAFASGVRKQCMENSSAHDVRDTSLIRWAELTIAFPPLPKQDISPA